MDDTWFVAATSGNYCYKTAIHQIDCQQNTVQMNKGFLQTGNLKMSAMQKREFPRGISETDSAVTQNVECAEEFEIPVACQGVEVRS